MMSSGGWIRVIMIGAFLISQHKTYPLKPSVQIHAKFPQNSHCKMSAQA